MLVVPPFKAAHWMLRQRRPLEPALSEAKGRRYYSVELSYSGEISWRNPSVLSVLASCVSRKLACMSAGKGAAWLDAPVTGSKHGAEKGELTFMIGGDREVLDRAMPVLQVLGKKHIYCGAHGSGLSAKLAQNVIQSTMVEIFCEGLVLATKAGV